MAMWAEECNIRSIKTSVEKIVDSVKKPGMWSVVALLGLGMLMPATGQTNPININNLHVPNAHSLYIMSGPVLCLHMRAASNAALSAAGGCCHRQELP